MRDVREGSMDKDNVLVGGGGSDTGPLRDFRAATTVRTAASIPFLDAEIARQRMLSARDTMEERQETRVENIVVVDFKR